MKLQITSHIFFLPYWNYLPRKINPKFFQILLNYETNRSHVNRCIYSTDIYPSIYIHNQPRNIRHRDKNEGKGGGKKKERKKGERNGTKGGWFTFPLRPASFLDLPTWNACTYTPAIHHTLRYDRRETRQFMRVLIFSLAFYFLFPSSLLVDWHRGDIRQGSRVKRHSRYR